VGRRRGGVRHYANLHYFNLGNGSGDRTHRKGVSFLRPKPEKDDFWSLEPQPESDYSYETNIDLERYVGTPVYLRIVRQRIPYNYGWLFVPLSSAVDFPAVTLANCNYLILASLKASNASALFCAALALFIEVL